MLVALLCLGRPTHKLDIWYLQVHMLQSTHSMTDRATPRWKAADNHTITAIPHQRHDRSSYRTDAKVKKGQDFDSISFTAALRRASHTRPRDSPRSAETAGMDDFQGSPMHSPPSTATLPPPSTQSDPGAVARL